MLDKLKSFFVKAEPQAATVLPAIVEPKAPNKPQAKQSFSKRTATSTGDQRLISTDRRTANLDILSLRNGISTKATIHDLAQVSPDLSASVYAYQRLVVTRNYSVVGRNLDGTVNVEATNLAQQLLARFSYLSDYNEGFAGNTGVHAIAEQLCMELRLYGSCAMELVLDKARVPNRLQPISTTQVEFVEDKTGYVYPIQRLNGVETPLDYPTFLYESLDQDLLSPYSNSPMEAALQSVLADTEFSNDLRRTIKRALHPRLNVSIDSDKFRKAMPIDVMGDADKMRAFQENFIGDLDTTVNGLEPDDALVSFDSVGFTYLNNGNSSLSAEWETLQSMTNSKMATGSKVPPSVLGHGSGSANIASTETQLFLKHAEGVQNKINSILSRAMTLGVRLLGVDAYCEFTFDRVNLRADEELEAFKAMKQSRILTQLSLGIISDEEAAIALTGRLPTSGAPQLSGTFFMAGATDPTVAKDANPLSNTGATNGGPQDQRPQTPTQPKGPVRVQRVK